MKLTKKDIGKKLRIKVWDNDLQYFIPKFFVGSTVWGEYKNEAGDIFGDSFSDNDISDREWEPYKSPKPPSKYDKLFKKFGCNEKHVKELITEIFKDLGKKMPKK